MKYLLIIILCIAVFICGCKNENVLSEPTTNQNQLINLNTLSVYQNDNEYQVVITRDGKVVGEVVFLETREFQSVHGLSLVKRGDHEQYLGKLFIDVEQQLGPVHTDIGSGFYVPAYITEDAYLICFTLDDTSVHDIKVYDLLRPKTGDGSLS